MAHSSASMRVPVALGDNLSFMSRRVIEYRCLLISPSDVAEEREAISAVIDRWNGLVGAALGASIRAVRWETDSVPDASAPAQQVLNRQIVDECDFGVAVFWTRLGTPTADHASGSIEEIERLRQRGARVMVYFNSAPIPQERLKDDQFQKLSDFKTQLSERGLLGSYGDIADLREQLLLHLTDVVTGLLQKERGLPPPGTVVPSGVVSAPKPDVQVMLFPAQTIPKTPGIEHLLGIRVENHSPVVVYISGISIFLKSGRALWLHRDAVSGMEQTRRVLQPGESFTWSADGDALLRDYAIDEYVNVVVQDDIRRDYRDAPGSLRKILAKWKEEKEVSKDGASVQSR